MPLQRWPEQWRKQPAVKDGKTEKMMYEIRQPAITRIRTSPRLTT